MPGIDNHAHAEERRPAVEALHQMTIAELLRHLRALDVELRVRDGKLALSAPAGVVTPQLQETLRSRKLELVEELLRREAAEERVAPLTYAQQRLWLIDRFAPQSAVYNIPQAWMVPGVVEEAALRRALALLAQRHAALRTRIEIRGGEPVQVVLREVEIPCRVVDLRAIDTEAEERAEIHSSLHRAGHEAFALDQAPLIRFLLFRLSGERSLVAYDVHHIVADQRSVDLLRRDLEALYLEAAGYAPASLRRLELTYAEVAERERSGSVQRLHEQQLEYWRERLRDMPAMLELPFARTSGAVQSDAGATIRMHVDARLTAGLRALAAGAKTSLYMTTLSLFSALLYRYTGAADLCIGTPLSGRKRREEEDMVGLFVNMLPIRCRIQSGEAFAHAVARISREVLEDFERGDVPFQRLVSELHPHRAHARSPFFHTMFALTPGEGSGEGNLEETFLAVSKFDLTVQLVERGTGMDIYLEYRTDLYDKDDIEELGRHYIALMQAVTSAPDTSIDRLPLLTEEDRALIARTNKTGLSFDRSQTLASLFQWQAEATPDAIAVRWQDKVISYRELHARAERLAAALSRAGAAPEQFVAVCLSRTPALLVAMLAIHKAGAAYLPLDPKYPVERLRYMLEDSGAQLLIAERGSVSEALRSHCPHVQLIFEEDDLQAATATVRTAAGPENAAYLIYTSGSTGKPKGVVVEHRNAVALLAWARDALDPAAYAGMLASTSVCFDLSVFEIFLPLATGKTIVLMDDVLELCASQAADAVTLVNTVPSAMHALLQAGIPKSVTTVCLAGEFLSAELVDRIYAAGVKQVFDLYGPTETTTYSTCVLRKPGEAANLGGAIANTQIYLLDERMQLVPPGVPGEIYIGGEGVTRGYLGRAELTAERFLGLTDLDARGRLYRTGDMARYRQDGALLFIGRRDQQVKVRGYRIELGEVEDALREVSGATEVAVVVRASGDALASYVEMEAASSAVVSEWAGRLRERLPQYMIPSSIMAVGRLPRTPNGKIDRQSLRSLAEPSAHAVTSSDGDESPRGPLEEKLAEIWARRLGLKRVARHAHFFESLGGHSLAAFEIFTEIETKLGVPMMLATLFQAPTVAQMAAVMRLQGWHDAASGGGQSGSADGDAGEQGA